MTDRPPAEELDSLHARVAELEAEAKELRQAHSDLAREHAFYRALVARAPVGLGIADPTGDFFLWNDALLSVYGYRPGDETEWERARQREKDGTNRSQILDFVRREGIVSGHEFPVRRADGSRGIALATIGPVEVLGEPLLHIMLQDVTNQKRLEGALQESELRFRQVAETLRHVFYITTGDQGVLYVSPAYERLWGRSRESLYADPQSWVAAIHEDDRARFVEQVAAGPVDGGYTCEYRIVRPDGSIRWVLDRAYELCDAEGRPNRVVGVAEDVTDRRRLEEQLREAQKMEAVGQLAGGVAHDFNNLLTVILAHVALLSSDMPMDDPRHDLIDEVERAASRARDLTRKLLGFSRRTSLELRPLDLRVTVNETVAMLRRTLDRRIQIVVEEPPSLGSVLADAGEMSQVLLNLCLNARDAMPEGGILSVRTRAARVSAERARDHIDARIGDAICLTVEDTGNGIAPEAQSRIFEPFFTTKEAGAGTGLGLAMVFGTVKQHQGWIEFSSNVGRGTRFDIYLPLHPGAAAARPASPEPAPRTEGGRTILFVDDEPGIRKAAAKVLSRHGYRVLLAEDGLAAIDVFRRERRSIDVVVLDLHMPRLSGRDTLQEIWRIDAAARVLVTSGHSADYEYVTDTEPVAGCLRKPWKVDQLVQAVQAAIAGAPVNAVGSTG